MARRSRRGWRRVKILIQSSQRPQWSPGELPLLHSLESGTKLIVDSQPESGPSSDQSIRRMREKNEKIQAALEEAMLKIKDQAAQLAEEVGLVTHMTVSYR